MYMPYEENNYQELKRVIDLLLKKYNLTTLSNAFEEALCKLAKVAKPTAAKFGSNQQSSGALINFNLALSEDDAKKFVNYFRDHYGDLDAELVSGQQCQKINGFKTYLIQLNSAILRVKVLPDVDKELQEILANDYNSWMKLIEESQFYIISHDEALVKIREYGKKLGLNSNKTTYIDETFLKMAGVKTMRIICKITAAKHLSGETEFNVGITTSDAEKFVAFFNLKKNDSAKLIETSNKLEGEGIYLQKIRVKNSAILDLTSQFIEKLNEMLVNEFACIEEYRKQSGCITKTTKDLAKILEELFQKIITVLTGKKENSNVPSLMEAVYRSGVFAHSEQFVAENSGFLKKGKPLQYEINYPPIAADSSIQVRELRPDKDGAATLKLANAIMILKNALLERASPQTITDAIENLSESVYFYKYACNSDKERSVHAQVFKTIKECKKEILSQVLKNARPDGYQIKDAEIMHNVFDASRFGY